MSLWAFRFLLWYVCVMLVQPQNRFQFLWPLHIGDITFGGAVGLHIGACMESRRPIIRAGPGTILALSLLFVATLSQHFGAYQISPAWNEHLYPLFTNALLLILVEAMAFSVERVWAVQMTALFCTLWWVKGGLRLSATGATYTGDRLMGVAVSLIENPNGFAYMLCVFLPLYLYAYQQAPKKWQKWSFLACALAVVWIVLETGSRTGLVTLLAISAFLVPFYGKNHFRALAIIAVTLAIIYPLTGEQNRQRFRTIPKSIAAFFRGAEEEDEDRPLTQDEMSARDRGEKNKQTWELIKENPILGLGINPDVRPLVERYPHAPGQVHCEILMAGRQMGFIGMGLYASLVLLIFFGGGWVKNNAAHWPAVRDLGWTFQIQALAIAVGGSFCPLPWHPPLLILAGSVSALMRILQEEKWSRLGGF